MQLKHMDEDKWFAHQSVDCPTKDGNNTKEKININLSESSQHNVQRAIITYSHQRIRSRSLYDSDQEPIVQEFSQNDFIKSRQNRMESQYPSLSYSEERVSSQRSLSQNSRSSHSEAGPQYNQERTRPAKDDYQKNIPGYITKECLKAMLSNRYVRKVQQLCQKKGVRLEEVNHLMNRLRQIPNISLNKLFRMLKDPSKANQVFRNFFTQYLRKRYTIYLIKQGKMHKKDKYIIYKKKLLYLQQTHISFNSNPTSSQQEIV